MELRTKTQMFGKVLKLVLLIIFFQLILGNYFLVSIGISSQAYAAVSNFEGDIDGDWDVDHDDLNAFFLRWLDPNCNETTWCNRADINRDLSVNFRDYALLLQNWKKADLSVLNENDSPTRLALASDGKVYVSDSKEDSVFIYDPNLDLIGELKGLDKPLGVAVGLNGDIFVANDGRDNVEVYDSKGVNKMTIGEGKIKKGNDLVLDRDGNIYVADSLSNVIWVYDQDGKALPNIGNGILDFPVALDIAYRDEVAKLYVGDQHHYKVRVFDPNGALLRSYGSMVSSGMSGLKWKGRFVQLQSLAVDDQGRLHAADCYMNRIQILNADTGSYIFDYGEFGKGPGLLNLPLDIAIDDTNDVIVTNYGNKRVEIIYSIP
ncbi:MAG: NHL repeat-containing protein [Planctomycetota bacterium]